LKPFTPKSLVGELGDLLVRDLAARALLAIDAEHHEGHLQLAVHPRHLGHGLVLRLVAKVAPHRLLRVGGGIVYLQRRLPGVRMDVDGDEAV
jgi:hypothetical protein